MGPPFDGGTRDFPGRQDLRSRRAKSPEVTEGGGARRGSESVGRDQGRGRARNRASRAPVRRSADPFLRSRDGLVGAAGIEPATTCSQSRYATAALRPGGANYPTRAGLDGLNRQARRRRMYGSEATT